MAVNLCSPGGLQQELARAEAGSQRKAGARTDVSQKLHFYSLCSDQTPFSILVLSLVPRAVASSWST